MYVQRVCACSCACLYVCILYCVCPYIVLHYKKLRFKLSRAQPAQATVRQMRGCAFPCTRKSYANGPALFVFPRVGSSLPPPPGKSVGRRRLALRVYRLLYPAESKVAEFVCKFKCLLPHATLNFDLHVGPRCRWTRGSTKEENNLRSGCGLKDLLCLIFSFQLVAPSQALLRTTFFVL